MRLISISQFKLVFLDYLSSNGKKTDQQTNMCLNHLCKPTMRTYFGCEMLMHTHTHSFRIAETETKQEQHMQYNFCLARLNAASTFQSITRKQGPAGWTQKTKVPKTASMFCRWLFVLPPPAAGGLNEFVDSYTSTNLTCDHVCIHTRLLHIGMISRNCGCGGGGSGNVSAHFLTFLMLRKSP